MVLNTAKDLGAVDLWSWLHISFPRKALENPQAWPTPVEASEIPKNSFPCWIHAEVTMILVNYMKTSKVIVNSQPLLNNNMIYVIVLSQVAQW